MDECFIFHPTKKSLKAGKIVFSTLDLSKGYYQLCVSEEDRQKTAFSTPKGHFQFFQSHSALEVRLKHFKEH